MQKMKWIRALAAVVTLAQAVPALAVDGLEGEKPRHKVKAIHELDPDAPKETGGKIQFIPTAKAHKQLRAEKRTERLAAKAEKRKARAEERARLHGLRQGKHAAKHAKKERVHKVRKARVHKGHAKQSHHPGRKHKKRTP